MFRVPVIWVGSFLALVVVGGCASVESQAKLTTEDVVSVIEQQLSAFKERDSEKAFSYASSEIKTQFVSAANFMRMVESRYPAIFFARSYSFERSEPHGEEGLVQQVKFIDQDGQVWVALYLMNITGVTPVIDGVVIKLDSEQQFL